MPAAADADALEDERQLQDPAVNRIIAEGTEEYLAGKSRPAEELLDELTREAQDDAAGRRAV